MLERPLNRYNDVERNFQSRQFQELVFKYGFECKYIQKEDFDKNIVLGEFKNSMFNKVYDLVCITRGVRDFGTQSFGTKFGFETTDQSTLYIDEKQLNELGLKLKIGDIIYFPDLNNKIFEVNFITNETDKVKYHFGTGFAWQIDIEKYSLNLSDRFVTNDEDINKLNQAKHKINSNNDAYNIKQDINQIYSIGNNPLLGED